MSALGDIAGADNPGDIAVGLIRRGYAEKHVVDYVNGRFSLTWTVPHLRRVMANAGKSRRYERRKPEPALDTGDTDAWHRKRAKEGSAALLAALLSYYDRRRAA